MLLWPNVLSHNVNESEKLFINPTHNSDPPPNFYWFFLGPFYIQPLCFMKITSVFFCDYADKQSKKQQQTNLKKNIILLDRGNKLAAHTGDRCTNDVYSQKSCVCSFSHITGIYNRAMHGENVCTSCTLTD